MQAKQWTATRELLQKTAARKSTTRTSLPKRQQTNTGDISLAEAEPEAVIDQVLFLWIFSPSLSVCDFTITIFAKFQEAA